MPYVRLTASGLVLGNPGVLQFLAASNQNTSAGQLELIDDRTNNAANHIFTFQIGGGPGSNPSTNILFSSTQGAFLLVRGLWLNLTGLTEILVVYT
jgi:hypothetical protein